ncbi:LysR family transcriptional regulator [Marinomonas transparens]|uniref:LysR family transcriptional regulator n=1 Tax=Marinomonas transparens TaxID=2795388 RepID=A0A934JJS1_9GAMM|nr:LysR family transcriptional regulator [Marinomonas transparens]MBJ7537076.1 LysR family transcriptional regulator [Marinomonas transparens]
MNNRKFPNKPPYGTSLDLTAIRIFVAIAETGSFVAAGKSIGLTRSAAGKALTRLEEYLETRLFHRTTRKVTLTTEGQEFYERCLQILHSIEEAESSLRAQPTQLKGILRITVSEGYGKMVIIPFVSEFQQQFPELSFDISFTDRIVDLVDEGVDLAIRVGDSYTSTQYITRVIDRSRVDLYASPGYLEKNNAPITLADLNAHQLLIYGSGSISHFQLKNINNHMVKLQGQSFIKFDNGDAIRVACCAGMGISLLPEFLVKNDVKAGRLIPLSIDELSLDEVAIHSLYPNRQFLSNRVRIFLDTLIEYLERNPRS